MMINDEMTKMRGSVHVLLLFIGGCSLNKRTIKCAKMRSAHAQFAMAARSSAHLPWAGMVAQVVWQPDALGAFLP